MHRIDFDFAPDGTAQIAETREGGALHRYTLAPGDDLAGQPAPVRAACEARWTSQVVEAHSARRRRAPPDPTGEQARAEAHRRLDALHAAHLRAATDDATPEERDTWTLKEEAARAYLEGGATDGRRAMMEMIEAEAAGDGSDPAALARRIVRKAEAYARLVGVAAGIHARAKAELARRAREAGPEADLAQALLPAIEKAALRFAEVSAARAG